MKINWKEVYEGRIKQINLDIRKAVHNKKWTDKAKLEAEKASLKEKISKMEQNNER